MIRYLLDTNICIYLIKKHPSEVLARFQQIQLKQLHIPTITLFELYYGIEKNNSQQRNLAALENFIAPLTVVDFTLDAAKKAAKIRSNLQQLGTPIGAYDIQIAAIALSLNMTLLTNNTREFKRVNGLKLENWVG
ncbi:MAG: type II toxin-antitoxin system VapC family toxin [Methylococcaceae bacterium]|nr:type II toxin-antitoxin system VapC family toxin [Methylococcaceae bacterium]MDZ4157419.1 type II toxin-antitoxin system VapC family toxin [Methylococcales bacterium]MDP2393666.1 type II toxin-antitoxin system VapC family toxin [Methylococcaceae bacterium]MDP3020698.1 type II toxin-antitoxin system VapC family toxin [Methylococcaceae bacterium]MDP3390445.1 type II toxin-antitoxin system VapC family toxin [Methylococcaceae bacterium]